MAKEKSQGSLTAGWRPWNVSSMAQFQSQSSGCSSLSLRPKPKCQQGDCWHKVLDYKDQNLMSKAGVRQVIALREGNSASSAPGSSRALASCWCLLSPKPNLPT